MTALRLHLLGNFELFAADGAPAPALPKKARALLAYVALARARAVSRDRLAALLWADAGEEQSRASLRQALTAIRRAVPAVEADNERVLLTAAISAVDVWEFEALAASDSEEALERAVAAYRGELLAGLRVDAPEFDDWRAAEAERLRGMATGAGSALVKRLGERGEHARAAENALRLLTMEPLREDLHRQLMQLYVRLGRPADALRQYRRCRTLLAQELGVQPDPETEALHRSIVEQRRRAPAPPEPVAPSPPAARIDPVVPMPVESPDSSDTREGVVVIADLAGFTAFAAGHDVEQVHAFLTRYRDGVRRLVRERGGLLTNFIGARVMMVFGAPVAHGDDAARALRTALALGAELGRARPEHAPGLAVRAGVASGRVIAGREEGQVTVTGAPVSLAARIMESTPAGEVWIADPVVHAMGERIDAEPLADVRIAALGGPLPVWRLRSVGRVSRARSIAFTGRAAEARVARDLLSRVIQRSQGHVLYIEGEAGIGKSRLLAHVLEQAAARGFQVHLGRTLDFGGGAGAEPLRAILSSILDVPSDGDPVTRTRRLDQGLERLTLTPSVRPPLGDLLDLLPRGDEAALWDAMDDPARARARQHAAIRAVAAAARQRPVLLAVDDLHWADEITCRMLEAIARGTRDQPVLMVVATRPKSDGMLERCRDAAGEEGFTALRLQPFSVEEALRLAWGYGVDDAQFLQDCVVRARGHPLYLDQLLRYGARSDTVPGSIQNVVLARLDALPQADRRALQAAAVLGQRFSPAALGALLDQPGYQPELLIAQSLLREEQGDLAFTHALIQEAVAASMLRDARVALHRKAAAYYDDLDGALAAEHLAAAGDPGAAPAFLEAARRAAARNQMERALRLALRGIEAGPDDATRVELLTLAGDAMADAGGVRESLDHYHAALAIPGSDAARCRALLGLAAALRVLDRQAEALDVLAEAEPLAGRLEDVRTQAQVQILRGSACFPIGRFDDCLNAYQRALDFTERAGLADLAARARGGLGDAHYQQGRLQSAHRMFDSCVGLARERRLVRVEVSNLPMLALTHVARGELAAGRALAEQAKSLARTLGDRRADALAEVVLAEIHTVAGAWGDAMDAAERAIHLSRRVGSQRFEADGLMLQAICLHAAGRDADARPLLERAWEIARQTSLNYFGPTILACMAQVADDPQRREWALAEGERLLEGDCVSHCYLHFYKIGIEIALDRGDAALALRYAGLLEDYTSREPLPLVDLVVEQARALARLAQGEVSPALRAQLQACRERAATWGFDAFLPRLDAALAVRHR